jgi:hypothetical protein
MKRAIIAISLILLTFVMFAHAEETEEIVFFVQSTKSVQFDAGSGVLTLKDVSPVMIWFTDRPQHLAGHEMVQDFVGTWGKGKDSFAADPPNATLSMFQDDQVQDAVVVLSNPRLKGNDLVYHVEVLEGKIPATAGISTLFIDSAVRRVARRTSRRTARRVERRHD